MAVCVPSPNFHFWFMRPPNHGQYLTSDGRVCRPHPPKINVARAFHGGLFKHKKIKVVIPKRPDQRYAMLSAIVHNMRQHENPESILDGFFDVMLKFPNDWVQLLYHDITLVMDSQGNDDFLEALLGHLRHEESENRIIV